MYKKILSLNTSPNGGGVLNKSENVTSTITLKDLKAAAVIAASASPPSSDVDVNDENAPSNFESVTNNNNSSDKVIYEGPYERPLAAIHASPTQTSHIQHHHHLSHVAAAPKIEGEMETDYGPEQQQQQHKSIHHTPSPPTTQHYRDMMADENLENRQQNFVNEEEDVWRPW
jgi:hypothetical protein